MVLSVVIVFVSSSITFVIFFIIIGYDEVAISLFRHVIVASKAPQVQS